MRPGEEAEIHDLVVSVFNEFIGCRYPPEGVREFLTYVAPASLRQRFLSNHFTLVATKNEQIVGMIEVRDDSHICLFFVDERLHRQGIGRGLFERALQMCRENRPDCAVIDVNSSPNSVGVYERLGFSQVQPEKTIHGITFVPMVLEIEKGTGKS
jgi:ribosomal protein S18 acetylase RimI-like enzyme